MLRLANDYSARAWRETERLSLATSAQWADGAALEAARTRRLRAYWRTSALSLVESGADIRPLLANAPGTGPLAETGKALRARAVELEADAPTEAASRYYTAGLFLGQAGLAGEAEDAHAAAFHLVQCAVDAGAAVPPERCSASPWSRQEVTVRPGAHRPGRGLVRYAALLSRLGRHGAQHGRAHRWRVSYPGSHTQAARAGGALH